jgi:hypothetical protein
MPGSSSHSTAEIASFVPDLPGTYVVQQIVNDGFVDSAPATVEIEAVRPGIELTREIRSLQRVIAKLAPKAFRVANCRGRKRGTETPRSQGAEDKTANADPLPFHGGNPGQVTGR